MVAHPETEAQRRTTDPMARPRRCMGCKRPVPIDKTAGCHTLRRARILFRQPVSGNVIFQPKFVLSCYDAWKSTGAPKLLPLCCEPRLPMMGRSRQFHGLAP